VGLAVSANDHKITYWDLNTRPFSEDHDEMEEKENQDYIDQEASTPLHSRKIRFSGHAHNVPSIGEIKEDFLLKKV
jgi:hypothetical protein